MKKFIFIISIAVLASCSTSADKYNPDKNLSPQELDANLWSMIRYLGRSPEGITPPERFYPAYDSHYKEQKKFIRIDAWYKKNDTHYFLVSRIAPSVVEKRVATGGKVVFDDKGGIQEYEELFRTWKLVPDTLKKRSLFLFDKMVQGENLKPFETRYSNGIEYIEFPDDRTYFDKVERTWKVKEQ
jgi:hypothetical protein